MEGCQIIQLTPEAAKLLLKSTTLAHGLFYTPQPQRPATRWRVVKGTGVNGNVPAIDVSHQLELTHHGCKAVSSTRFSTVVEEIQSTEAIEANFEVVTDLKVGHLLQKVEDGCLDLRIFKDLGNIHVEEVLEGYNYILAVLSDLEGRDKGLLGLVDLVVLVKELTRGRGQPLFRPPRVKSEILN